MVAEVWLIGKTCHLSATLAVQDPEGETTSLDSKSYSGCHHWSSHRLHPYSSEGLGRTSTNWEACRCSWSWCCFKAVLMFQGMCCVPSNPAIDNLILLHFKIEDLMILPPQLRPRPQVRPHDLKAFTSTSSSIYMVYLDWWPPKWDTAWKKHWRPNGLINALKSTSGRSMIGFHWECIHLGYRTSGISGWYQVSFICSAGFNRSRYIGSAGKARI